MEKEKSISSKLVYSAVITTLLPFINGVELLSTFSIPKNAVENLKNLNGGSIPDSYALNFLAGFISNILFYNINLESRIVFSFCAVFYGLAAFLAYFTNHVYLFYTSRFLIGFSTGIVSNLLSCYLSLISPINTRGIFSSLYIVGLVGGLFTANTFQPFFQENYYTIMAIIGATFCILPVFIYFTIPYKAIAQGNTKTSIFSLISSRKAIKSLLMVALFHSAHNFCGINQIALNPASVYGPDFRFHVSFSLLIGFITTFLSGYFLEHFGRKTLVLMSAFIVMVCSFLIYLKYQIFYCTYLFSFGFNIGLGNIPYVILGEVFPTDCVAPGALFGTSCNWISALLSMLIPQGSPDGKYNFAFLGYASTTFAFIVFVLVYFKETKGKLPEFQ